MRYDPLVEPSCLQDYVTLPEHVLVRMLDPEQLSVTLVLWFAIGVAFIETALQDRRPGSVFVECQSCCPCGCSRTAEFWGELLCFEEVGQSSSLRLPFSPKAA
jgi:hypothetical protein